MIATVDRLDRSAAPEGQKFQSETYRPERRPVLRGRARKGEPSTAWSLAELTAAAQRENERIEKSKTFVTPRYWRLGRALNLVRKKKKFPRGTWEPWLAQHKIKKLNAFRARRLAKYFSSVQKLRGLALEDALAIAKRRSAAALPQQARQKIRRRLRRIAENLIATAEEIARVDAPDSLLDDIELAERASQTLRAAVESHHRQRPK